MTLAEFREWLLDVQTTTTMIRHASRGLTSEIVAGVCKLMSNLDLHLCGQEDACHGALQHNNRFARHIHPVSSRITRPRPEGHHCFRHGGLLLGCGDAVLGLNPVDDSVESVSTYPEDVRRIQEQVGDSDSDLRSRARHDPDRRCRQARCADGSGCSSPSQAARRATRYSAPTAKMLTTAAR